MTEPNAFFDGFEALTTTVGGRLLDGGWWIQGNGASVTYINGRFSGNRGITPVGGSVSDHSLLGRTFEDGAQHEYFAMAAAVKISSFRTGGQLDNLGMYPFAVMFDPNNLWSSHIGTRVNNDGSISIMRRTGYDKTLFTELARTRGNVIVPNNWQYVSWRGRIHDTDGESTIAVDGEVYPEATFTNLDTKFDGSTTARGVGLGSQGHNATIVAGTGLNAGELNFDDFVMNSSGVLIPERRIDPLLVNGDGTTLNLVPSTGSTHYGVVDESIADLTDYLSGTSVGDLDELALQNMAYTPTTIDGVRVKAVLSKTDANTRAWRLGVKQGVATAGSEDQYVSVNPAWYDEFYWVDPASGVAFTKADVDSLQLRPRITV